MILERNFSTQPASGDNLQVYFGKTKTNQPQLTINMQGATIWHMAELTTDQLAALAKLSRLELTKEDLASLAKDLSRILDYIAQLDAIQISDLSPYGHMQEQNCTMLRKDEVQDSLPRATFLANTPDHVGGMIRVPTVIHNASKNS